MTVTAPNETTSARQALAQALNRPAEELEESQLLTDLVAESFALIEAVIRIQETLGIRLVQEDLREVETVGDLLRVCADRGSPRVRP